MTKFVYISSSPSVSDMFFSCYGKRNFTNIGVAEQNQNCFNIAYVIEKGKPVVC